MGVLETFKNGSRRLVPVTFFYERHYYDATFYHATPVPFTLYSETVYEVQQFGKSLGTFTVQSATRELTRSGLAMGALRRLPDAATLAKKACAARGGGGRPIAAGAAPSRGKRGRQPGSACAPAAGAPTGAEDDPDRPKLHRREGSESATARERRLSAGCRLQQWQTTGADASPASQPEESSGQDPDRPKLHRRDDSSAGNGSAPTSSPSGGNGSARKASSRAIFRRSGFRTGSPGTGGGAAASQTAEAELTPSEDPDHPILRRGKPVQEQGGHDLPDFKLEEPVTRQVAVSDAGPSEPQPLIYVCPQEERQQMEALARELAQAELRRVAAERGIVLPAAAKSMRAGEDGGLSKTQDEKAKQLRRAEAGG